MNKKPLIYTLVQIGDTVEVTDSNYFEEKYHHRKMIVISHDVCLEAKKDCMSANHNYKECTCWQYFRLKDIESGVIFKDVIFDEFKLIDIKK